MTGKFALLIGNSQYQDPILARLKAPDSDVSELTTILEDPSIGGFDQVIPVFSESSTVVRVAIGDFFAEKKKDDLLLLYFSGHGVLDENGRLYLAVKDTQHNRLSATGIPTSFIKDEMENCRSRRQVLVLDCCHSGAFSRGKGLVGLNAITRATFEGAGGYGQVVITATDATQYALEGDQVIGNVETSLFTHFMIEGLRTGQADSDRDGRITVDELYDYVYEQVGAQTPHQTPRKWEQAREGEELVIARSRYRPTDLPSELRQALESTIPNVREGVVRDLGHLLRGSDKSLGRLARGILKAMSKEDDSLRVRNAASAILKDYEERKTAKDRPRPSMPSPLERTQPTKPIPILPKKPTPVHQKSGPPSNPPKALGGNWLSWGGIGTGLLLSISIFVYVFGNFVMNAVPTRPSDTPTSTLTAQTLETVTSTLTVSTNVMPSLTPDTLVSPTLTSTATNTPTVPTATPTLPASTPTPTPTSTTTNTPTYTPTNMPTATPTPTVTWTPANTPLPQPIYPGPWRGEYYDNEDLSGSPRLTRDDPEIKFNWNEKPPADGMPLVHFSARWRSQSQICFGNRPSIYAHHDDALKIYIDGNLYYDGSTSNDKWLDYGIIGCHSMTIEFRQFTGGASVTFGIYQH